MPTRSTVTKKSKINKSPTFVYQNGSRWTPRRHQWLPTTLRLAAPLPWAILVPTWSISRRRITWRRLTLSAPQSSTDQRTRRRRRLGTKLIGRRKRRPLRCCRRRHPRRRRRRWCRRQRRRRWSPRRHSSRSTRSLWLLFLTGFLCVWFF